ncbi:MAG: hypothetical protein AB1631_34055, partial [Acidobacteriota bacterium]
QIWIVWVVMTGVLLLTILIGLLTTAVGLQGENVLAELRGFLETSRGRLVDWQKQLAEPVIEAEPLIEAEYVEVDDIEASVTTDDLDGSQTMIEK